MVDAEVLGTSGRNPIWVRVPSLAPMKNKQLDYAALEPIAKMVALAAHKDQMYGEILPYEKHLQDVVNIQKRHGCSGQEVICGWLHDTIEDSRVTYAKIKEVFGVDVAELVFSVTDELGRNRAERKLKTFPKIVALGEKSVKLKLADRIANMRHSYESNSSMQKVYLKEADEFKTALYNPLHVNAKSLWQEFDEIIEAIKISLD